MLEYRNNKNNLNREESLVVLDQALVTIIGLQCSVEYWRVHSVVSQTIRIC